MQYTALVYINGKEAGGHSGGHGGGGGLQIPTSMEQMTAQATSFLKKIAPTPPSQPPSAPQKDSSALFVSDGLDGDNPDIIIGGEYKLDVSTYYLFLKKEAGTTSSSLEAPMCKGAISDFLFVLAPRVPLALGKLILWPW